MAPPRKQRRAAIPVDLEKQLREEVAKFATDPSGFVLFAFPWGKVGGPLAAHRNGPDAWQWEFLKSMGKKISPDKALQMATASGKGIGKSSLVAWIVLWAMCTCPDTRGVVTANTATQLSTKTWAELAKWYHLMICKHWFELTATAIFAKDPQHQKTWRIDAIPWSETNPEAFAGLHNEGKRIVLIFDEASSIHDKIWEVAEAAMTDANTEIFWMVFGNPTRNTGRFKDCFGVYRHLWECRQIDSRNVKITNKKQINQWIDTYGEDSDYVRVLVRGIFPRVGSMQLIPSDLVDAAIKRLPQCNLTDPLIFGVDIARHGDDMSVIAIRKGRDATIHPWVKMRIMDTMVVASRVAEEARRMSPDAIFVDCSGIGWGVYDRLVQLKVQNVFPVDFSSGPTRVFEDPVKVANKRAEMWWAMREWLKAGTIPDDKELYNDLVAVQYGYSQWNEIQLEKKKDMKKRGIASPDAADALACTWALPVGPKSSPFEGMGPFDTIKRPGPYDAMQENWDRDVLHERDWLS